MMQISGINFLEEGNVNSVYLYKEGSFWKAYERSAYLFVKHIKNYRVKKKYYKIIDQEVVSIGFPDVALEAVIKEQEIASWCETSISLEVDDKINLDEYEAWKDSIILTPPKLKSEKKEEETICTENILSDISSFPLLDKTPLECMQFIATLQRAIQ